MMKNILFCQYCDSEVEATYKKEQITSTINGDEVSIEFDIPYCSKCGRELSDLDLEEERYESLYNKYRQEKKLLLPEQIKAIREKYGLSQRAFSRVLGFAESTINRYELGSIQDKTNNTLIKLSDNPISMAEIFNENRDNLNSTEQNNLQNRLNGLLNAQNIDCTSIEEKLNFLIDKTNIYDRKFESIDKKLEVINKKISSNVLDNKKSDSQEYFEDYKNPLKGKADLEWKKLVN